MVVIADNLITAIKEQLIRDIPSEIHHEVKQQVHWCIVEVKKLWKEAARKKDVLAKKKTEMAAKNMCGNRQKKNTSGQLGSLRPSGPTRKTGLLLLSAAPVTVIISDLSE